MINWNTFILLQIFVGFFCSILSKSEILYYDDVRKICYKGLIEHKYQTKLISLDKMEYYIYSVNVLNKCNNFWNRCGYDNFVFGPYMIKNKEEFMIKLYISSEALVFDSKYANDNWFITSTAEIGELLPVINYFEREGLK